MGRGRGRAVRHARRRATAERLVRSHGAWLLARLAERPAPPRRLADGIEIPWRGGSVAAARAARAAGALVLRDGRARGLRAPTLATPTLVARAVERVGTGRGAAAARAPRSRLPRRRSACARRRSRSAIPRTRWGSCTSTRHALVLVAPRARAARGAALRGRARGLPPARAEPPAAVLGARRADAPGLARAANLAQAPRLVAAVLGGGFRRAFRHGFGTGWWFGGWYVSNVCSRRWMGRVDQALERAPRGVSGVRSGSLCRAGCADQAAGTQLVRAADDRCDWRAAGCSSSAQWLAQVSSSDHRTAVRITRTSDALRSPAGARPCAGYGRVVSRAGSGGHFRSTRGCRYGVRSKVSAGAAGACGADGGGGAR